MMTQHQKRSDQGKLLSTRVEAIIDQYSRLVVDPQTGPGCTCLALQATRSERPANTEKREIF